MSSFLSRFGLAGRTALVTGASRGIGRAIALGLAQAGADVALLARNTTALEETGAEMATSGRRALPLGCDVTDAAAVRAAVDTALTEFGHLDIVVNNAGGCAHAGPFNELNHDDWSETMRLNFDAVVEVCRAVGPHLVRRGTGAVVNVSAVAGIRGAPTITHYAAAKAAVHSLTRSLATEWARSGVRVNAVAPGWIETDMTRTRHDDPNVSADLIKAVPSGQWATPEDIVGPVVFLAGDAARHITGVCLPVDGGMTSYEAGPAMLDRMARGRHSLATAHHGKATT